MQSVVHDVLHNPTRSKECLRIARESKSGGDASLEMYRRKDRIDSAPALGFAHLEKEECRILTGGSLRMKVFLYEHVFEFVI